jgi:transcriptional regulator with XRE-family HTH domain
VPSENSNLNKSIGETLRRVRVSRGHNLSVANEIRTLYKIKLDPSYLSRMELGKAEVPLRTLIAFADYYQIPLNDILKHSIPQEKLIKGINTIIGNDQVHNSLLILIDELGEEKTLELIRGYLTRTIDLISEITERHENKNINAASATAKKRIRRLKL